jgi:hypothetical protein
MQKHPPEFKKIFFEIPINTKNSKKKTCFDPIEWFSGETGSRTCDDDSSRQQRSRTEFGKLFLPLHFSCPLDVHSKM